jgi:hypothetical protein
VAHAGGPASRICPLLAPLGPVVPLKCPAALDPVLDAPAALPLVEPPDVDAPLFELFETLPEDAEEPAPEPASPLLLAESVAPPQPAKAGVASERSAARRRTCTTKDFLMRERTCNACALSVGRDLQRNFTTIGRSHAAPWDAR